VRSRWGCPRKKGRRGVVRPQQNGYEKIWTTARDQGEKDPLIVLLDQEEMSSLFFGHDMFACLFEDRALKIGYALPRNNGATVEVCTAPNSKILASNWTSTSSPKIHRRYHFPELTNNLC
jgi:hypothetical protein